MDYTVVVCDQQTKGRGQIGNIWVSEPFKNLTFSVLKFFEGFGATRQFEINMVVSLAIYDVLNGHGIPELKIKWPNDIMSCNHKICGILIENMLQGRYIRKAILGVGLNVNQLDFGDLPKVSSMKLLLDREFDLQSLLHDIVEKLKFYFQLLGNSRLQELYEQELFRIGEISTFQSPQREFKGIIKGVDASGRLMVYNENKETERFAFKEVKLLY